MGCLATNVVGNRIREHYPKCNCEPAWPILGELDKEPIDRFLPISSSSVRSLVLLELSRGRGKNDHHCGSYLHLAPVSCL